MGDDAIGHFVCEEKVQSPWEKKSKDLWETRYGDLWPNRSEMEVEAWVRPAAGSQWALGEMILEDEEGGGEEERRVGGTTS